MGDPQHCGPGLRYREGLQCTSTILIPPASDIVRLAMKSLDTGTTRSKVAMDGWSLAHCRPGPYVCGDTSLSTRATDGDSICIASLHSTEKCASATRNIVFIARSIRRRLLLRRFHKSPSPRSDRPAFYKDYSRKTPTGRGSPQSSGLGAQVQRRTARRSRLNGVLRVYYHLHHSS